MCVTINTFHKYNIYLLKRCHSFNIFQDPLISSNSFVAPDSSSPTNIIYDLIYNSRAVLVILLLHFYYVIDLWMDSLVMCDKKKELCDWMGAVYH